MPPLTMRVWGSGRGKIVHHVQTNGTEGVRPDSSVFAAVTEVDHQNFQTPFIGNARVFVCNVAPGAGYVDVWVHIDWDSDLPYRLTLLIVD